MNTRRAYFLQNGSARTVFLQDDTHEEMTMKTMMAGCVAGLMLAMLMQAQWAMANPVPSNVLFLTNIEKMQLGMPIDTNPPPLPPGFTPSNSFWEPRPIVFHGAEYTNNLRMLLHRYQGPPGTTGIVVKFRFIDLEPDQDFVALCSTSKVRQTYHRYTGHTLSAFYSSTCTGDSVEVWAETSPSDDGDMYAGVIIEGFYCRLGTGSGPAVLCNANPRRTLTAPDSGSCTNADLLVAEESNELKRSSPSFDAWPHVQNHGTCCITNPLILLSQYSGIDYISVEWGDGVKNRYNVKKSRRFALSDFVHLYSSTGTFTIWANGGGFDNWCYSDVRICASEVPPNYVWSLVSYLHDKQKGYSFHTVWKDEAGSIESDIGAKDDGAMLGMTVKWGDGCLDSFARSELSHFKAGKYTFPDYIAYIDTTHAYTRTLNDKEIKWAGTYVVVASATDNVGLRSDSDYEYCFYTKNVAPCVASFKATVSGTTCRAYIDTKKPFSKQFRDKDGYVIDCFWRFTLADKVTLVPGSLPQYRGMEATCVLPGPGKYCVILRAIDNLGACSDKVKKITVK